MEPAPADRPAMRAVAPLVAAAVLLAGCAADAQDPFAYTKKPLYTGHFELDPLAGGKTDGQQFRVEDGSIAEVHVQVWINATAGQGKVEVVDPSGATVLTATEAYIEQSFPLELGVWKVVITGTPDADGELKGHTGILVTRR